jgi:DNA-binding NtrC family response regulator
MAHLRSMAADLARLLSAVAAPIYVLNDERRIIYANSACAEWLAISLEEFVGQSTAYHSSPTAEAGALKAAGLCPPPEVLSGRRMRAIVACDRGQGQLSRRRAEFIPLGVKDEEVVAILALVEPIDLPAGVETSANDFDDDAAESAALHERLRRLHGQLRAPWQMDRLVGESPAMARVRAQVQLAWSSGASVAIVGQQGSGRQHVAKAIHYGQRAAEIGDLVPLACSGLSAELLRSEIEAVVRQPEQPEQPVGRPVTTLLLNEVDELPGEVQAALADLLAGDSLSPRIIATSSGELGDLAARGLFRRELAAQLSTIEIHLPPLTERREDVPLLAQMFLEEFNAEGERQLQGFSPEALDQLAAYSWPGNIDELSAMVREAHRAAEGRLISPRDLPQRIYLAAAAERHPRRKDEPIDLDKFLAGIELELIQRALRRAKGNKTKAAKLLGLTRPRLYRRLVQLGLEKEA